MTIGVRNRFAWFAGALALVLLIAPALAKGPSQPERSRRVNVEITFIKWITTYPDLNMEGFVGGDMTGAFAGKVHTLTPTSTGADIEATYSAGVGDDFFKARIKGKQNDTTHTATLNGLVTEGPMKGAHVQVYYDVIAECGQAGAVINRECYMGTIHIFGRVKR